MGHRKALPLAAIMASTEIQMERSNGATVKEVKERKETEQLLNSSLTAELKPPKELTAGAKKIWTETVENINKAGIQLLKDLDVATLKMYCSASDMFNKAALQLKSIIESNNDNVAVADKDTQDNIDKCMKIQKQAYAIIKDCAIQLALTPTARANIAYKQAKNITKSKYKAIDDFNNEEI